MKHIVRRALRFVLALSVLLILVAGCFLLYLNSDAGHTYLREYIAREMGAPLGATVTIERLETNLFTRMELGGIAIRPSDDAGSTPHARIDLVRIAYSIPDLLSGGAQLDSLVAEGVLVSISQGVVQKSNAPISARDTMSPDASPPDTNARLNFPLRIGYAELSNATLLYDDRSVPLFISCTNINAVAGMDDELRGDFHFSIDSVRLGYFTSPVTVTDFRLGGSVNRGSPIIVDTFRADVADLHLEGNLSGGLERLAGAVGLSGDPKPLLGIILEGAPDDLTKGPVSADVEFVINHPLTSPAVDWSLKIPSITVAGIPVSDLRYDGRWSSDTLGIADLSLKVFDGTLSGKGWMVIDSMMAHRFKLDAEGVRISELWKSRTADGPLSGVPVSVNVQMESTGELGSPADVTVKSTLSVFTPKRTIVASALTFSGRHLAVRSEGGMVDISSEIDLQGEHYDGTVDIVLGSLGSVEQIAPIFGIDGLEGSLGTHALVSGDFSTVDLRTTTTCAGLSYKTVPFADTLWVSLRMEDGRPFIDSSAVSGANIDVGALVGALGDDAAGGRLSYFATARGALTNISATLRADVDQPSYESTLLDQAGITAELSDSVLTITELIFKRDSMLTAIGGSVDFRLGSGTMSAAFSRDGTSWPDTIHADFDYRSAGDYRVSAASRDFAVNNLREFFPELPFSAGQADWSLEVRQERNQVTGLFPFMILGLAAGKGSIDSIAGALRFEDGAVVMDSLSIAAAGRRHFVSSTVGLARAPGGGYHFDWEGRTKGRITGDPVDLALVNSFLSDTLDLAGTVDVELHWDGVVKRPLLKGSLEIRDARIGPVQGTPWLSEVRGTLTLGHGVIGSDSITAVSRNVPLLINVVLGRDDSTVISGSLDVSSRDSALVHSTARFTGDSVDVLFESRRLDLAVVQPFVEDLQKLRGTLTAAVAIHGRTAGPEIRGSLEITDMSFGAGSGGMSVTGGRVNARMISDRIVLDSASAGFGGGRIFASGDLPIDSGGVRGLDMNLRGAGVKFSEAGLYQVDVDSANLHLKSVNGRTSLRGTLAFGPTRFTRDVEISDLWEMMVDKSEHLLEETTKEPLDLMAMVRENPAVEAAVPEFVRNIELDLALKNASGLWVDNNIASIRTLHDLYLRGTYDAATLTGRVTVQDRGTLKFLDREFEIITGVVEFANAKRVNPIVNMTAQAEVTESAMGDRKPTTYTLTMTVTGPLDDVEYELTSKPPLERADIISLLALGMTRYQLEATEDKNAVYRTRSEILASQQISNSVNRFFDNWLGDFLALDHVGLGGNLFDPNETRFEVTKRWSDRVEVSYSTSIKSADRQILSVEYKINEFLYLEGKTDEQQESGADLKFRVRFK